MESELERKIEKIEKINKLLKEIEEKQKNNSWNNLAKKIILYSFHTANKKIPANFGKLFNPVGSDDLKIINKIKSIYKQNEEVFEIKSGNDIWQNYIIPMNQNFLDNLKNDNENELHEFLHNLFCNDAGYGFISLPKEWSGPLENNEQFQESLKLFFMDTLVCFAEWLGVIPIENIEQNVYGEAVCLDPEYLLNLIEQKLGFEIKFPEFQNGMYGILTSKGAFLNRHFIYLYIALKIKEICKNISNPRICEIGGGVGLLAYYCDLIGLKDITIIDIPTVSLISSYFLMKNLPNRQFLFSSDTNKYKNKKAIKLLFPKYFNEAPAKQYDIVVNCDSLPEINVNEAKNYVESIKKNSRLFYSINQEAKNLNVEENQNLVHELIDNVGGFNRKSRNLFWLRRGYVEELYEINE